MRIGFIDVVVTHSDINEIDIRITDSDESVGISISGKHLSEVFSLIERAQDLGASSVFDVREYLWDHI